MPSTSQVPGQSGYAANRPVVSTTTAAAAAAPGQHRQRYDESWVEVSSQPSSSSVSSVGDEIDTTGLQVGSSYRPRRRRSHQQSLVRVDIPRSAGSRHAGAGTGGSSQEEYDETESEEDHVLTSSTENVAVEHGARQTPFREVSAAQGLEFDQSDDDENATALGMRPPEPFRPQPNAFTHPPSHLLHRHSTSSVFSHHGRRPSFTRRSQTRGGRRTPDFMSPNYQADNDAALRASLTTLLSCAAAARSLPKDGEKEPQGRAGPVNSNQPVALRFAPESELLAPPPPQTVPAASRGHAQASGTRSTSSSPPAPAITEKNKRTATPTPNSKPLRPTKKKRAAVSDEVVLSPTVMAWVISAGVVVLVSVVGFGAGYVFGREVGRQESLGNLASAGNVSAVAEGGSCGREVLKTGGGTLRRFRWGSGIGRSVVA